MYTHHWLVRGLAFASLWPTISAGSDSAPATMARAKSRLIFDASNRMGTSVSDHTDFVSWLRAVLVAYCCYQLDLRRTEAAVKISVARIARLRRKIAPVRHNRRTTAARPA
jgi:hypothetical protein